MSDENKRVVREYVEAFNRGDMDALIALFTPDAQIQGVLGWGGLDIATPIWRDLISCLKMQLIVDAMISEGDTVAVRYVERGTSVKEFRGMGPTGKSYEIIAMEWFVLEDGKIHRRWGARDSATISRQLGFL